MTLQDSNIEVLEDEIKDLDARIEQLQRTERPFAAESSTFILMGALGLLGAAQAMALLWAALGKEGALKEDSSAPEMLQAAKQGLNTLGDWGPTVAAGTGWLLLLGLLLALLWKQRSWGWPVWGFSLGLIFFPFFDPPKIKSALDMSMGLSVACGLFSLVLLLQRSKEPKNVLLDLLWGPLITAALGLLVSGILVPWAPAAYLGVLLLSCLTVRVLFLGLRARATDGTLVDLQETREDRRAKIAQARRRKHAEEELRRLLGEALK